MLWCSTSIFKLYYQVGYWHTMKHAATSDLFFIPNICVIFLFKFRVSRNHKFTFYCYLLDFSRIVKTNFVLRIIISCVLLLLYVLFRVSKNHEVNQMSATNLGIVFGPTLLKPKWAFVEFTLHWLIIIEMSSFAFQTWLSKWMLRKAFRHNCTLISYYYCTLGYIFCVMEMN